MQGIISSKLQISCASTPWASSQTLGSIAQAMKMLCSNTDLRGTTIRFSDWKKRALEEASKQVARLVGSTDPGKITFYYPIEEAWRRALDICVEGVDQPHIVCDEHMERYVFCDRTVVPSTPRLAVCDVISAILPRTCAVVISLGNPAVGTLQPAADIAQALNFIGKDAPLFAVDLSTVAELVMVDLQHLKASLTVVSGMGIPNVAALVCQDVDSPQEDYDPLLMPYFVGLGRAAQIASDNLNFTETLLRYRRSQLIALLNKTLDSTRITISLPSEPVLPNILVVSFTHQHDFDVAAAGLFDSQAEDATSLLIPYLRMDIPLDLARRTMTLSFGIEISIEDIARRLKQKFGATSQN